MNIHDLITAAQAAHTDELAAQAIDKAEEESCLEEDRQGTIKMARAWALEILGAPAEALQWRHHPEGETKQGLSSAIAALTLPPGHVHTARLIYLLDSLNSSSQTLVLARTCHACADELLNEVDSLAALGRLLDNSQPEEGDADGQEPGPLTAIEQIESYSVRVAQLARRLLAEHPDAGLTVRYTSLYGNDSSGGRAELQLRAASVDAVRQVAASLGAEVTTRNSSSMRSLVLQHADAEATVDGISVDLSGYSQLPDDEAAAWLAQRNQATAGAGEGETCADTAVQAATDGGDA